MSFITELLNQYGYIALYLALMLELLGLPLPGELLMTYCGFLVFQGTLNFAASVIFSAAGVITGITIAYFIGRKVGKPFLYKYGVKIHMGPDKLEKLSGWLNKYGNGLLVVAYFIPGVRHITGYFPGILKVNFRKFSFNAYIGAIIWPITFIIIGKTLGRGWHNMTSSISNFIIIGCICIGLLLILAYLIKSYKKEIFRFINYILELAINVFHSLGKVRFIVLSSVIIFITLAATFVAIIKTLLSNELGQFDTITAYLAKQIFTGSWKDVFNSVDRLTTDKIIFAISILLFIFIVKVNRDNLIELKFLVLTIWGGKVFSIFTTFIFYKCGLIERIVNGDHLYTLPNEKVLMAVVVAGFITFVLSKHIENKWGNRIILLISLSICIFLGLSQIVLGKSYPTEIIIGYILGGLWLSLNIIFLEVFRILGSINKNIEIKN